MAFSKLLAFTKVKDFDFLWKNTIEVHVLVGIFTDQIVMEVHMKAIQESVDFILLRNTNIRDLIFRWGELVEHSLAEDVCYLLDALLIQKAIKEHLCGYYLL